MKRLPTILMAALPALLAQPAFLTPTATAQAVEEQVPAADEAVDPATGDDVLDHVTPPELIEFTEAKLPPELDLPDGDYVVVLALTIDENGAVTEAVEVESPRKEFTDAATQAAMKFKFKPAMYQGQPVLVQVQYDYQFQVRQKVRDVVYAFLTLEKGTRDSLSEVSGFIEETGDTFTSVNGRMEIANLKPGTYTLYIPAVEF